MTWPGLITTLLEGKNLTRAETAWAMEQVMTAEASTGQLAGFLIALRAKGETIDELAGLVDTMLLHAVRIEVPGNCVDVVGTGGDRRQTVNISTAAAIVVAGAGFRVVKHGNRAASSAAGAADVLQALGVRLDLPPQRVAELATEVGITFCFAQKFHPAFRHAATARSQLGVPTAFNYLGPLTNPAQPRAGAIGVASLRMAPIVAGVLAQRGGSGLVFRGDDGLDELSTTGTSQVWVVVDGTVTHQIVDSVSLGLPTATLDDLRGGDADHNARLIRALLEGRPGPVREAVLLNAAAAIVAVQGPPAAGSSAGPDSSAGPGLPTEPGLQARLSAGIDLATRAVDSGAAAEVLDRWVKASAS